MKLGRPPTAPLYAIDSYRINDGVGYLIAKVRWMLIAALDREVSAFEISSAQVVMLLCIAQGMGETAAELAREMEYDTGSMTRMLGRLEAKKLIRRRRSGHDRRCVRLSLTAEGERLARKLPAAVVKVLNQHLHSFSRKELDLFKSFLRRMLAVRQDSGFVRAA